VRLRRARTCPCGAPLDLSIFGSEERALEHIRKHVLDASERWDTIVRPDALAAARAGDPAALERVYDDYAREIEAGLRFGERLPCHLHGVRPAAANLAEPPCTGFLSRRGVKIFADDRRVRTAYRTALRQSGHSDYAYFARAWFDFLTRSSGKACLGRAAPPTLPEWKRLEGGEGAP
jgi:hypothetical protein